MIRTMNITMALIILMSGTAVAYPEASWDWREHGGVTSVKDSGDCDCCWAFAMMAVAEGCMKAGGYPTYDFSEESLKECPWGCKYGPADCKNGGDEFIAIHHMTHHGMVLESDNPYRAFDTYCNDYPTPVARVTDWDIISTWVRADTDELKQYIRTYGPVYSKLDASCFPPELHKELLTCDSPAHGLLNHAVAIVGWDDNMGPGCWICKNDDGTEWGDQGYFYLEYGCSGIGFHASAITGYERWDPNSRTLGYDDAGWGCQEGAGSQSDAWGLCMFGMASDEKVTHIEFWTTGETDDVDLYLYDGFNGHTFGNLLYKDLDLSFRAAGYHSVEVFRDVPSTTGIIVIVAHINNVDNMFHTPSFYPIVGDDRGKIEKDKTYLSRDGVDWVPMNGYMDVALRLRVAKPPPPPPPVSRSTTVTIILKLAASGGYDQKYDLNGDGKLTSLDALLMLQRQ